MLRRIEWLSLGLVALCFGYTAQVEFFGLTYREAGGLIRYWLWDGDTWRTATTILIHGGWIHLLFNGLALYILGNAVARGLGRLVFFLSLLFSALAGLAVSLLTHDPDTLLLGISGGVLGLLGLILAVEWSLSRSLMEFVRRRNTKVVLFFLALNALLALLAETGLPDVKLDHAAHAAGLSVGLLTGLAYYGRGRRRPRLGLAVALLLSVAPLTYAAHPFLDPGYYDYVARSARAKGDDEAEARALERVWELDEGNAAAGARLAVLRDDPAYLEAVEVPDGARERDQILRAYLELAERRFASDPDRARDLAQAALAIDFPPPDALQRFAARAERAGLPELANLAYASAAQELAESASWEAAVRALGFYSRLVQQAGLSPEARVARALDAAKIAYRATGSLDRDEAGDDADRARFQEEIAALAARLGACARIAAAAQPPPRGLNELYLALERIYLKLADNSRDDLRDGYYLFHSSYWWWRRIEGTPTFEADRPAVLARVRAALDAARDADWERVSWLVRVWLADRGLSDRDLADSAGGG